jgi:D-alanyl-D-alanine carboxypeptidase/D-alanyl-D-alanine-endopeptidase (penicillin-binding protein 4)
MICRACAAVSAALVAVTAQAAPRQYSKLSDDERATLVEQARESQVLSERIEKVSNPFVGTPYGESPLGEGVGIDTDPRLRWDRVDCLTFVETSMALALAPAADRLLPVLDDIRYGAQPPSFEHRNHFMESEWVPRNVEKGYLRGISREIAGAATLFVTTTYTPEKWHARASPKELPLPDEAVPMGTFGLEVVPLSFAQSHASSIPEGTLLIVVRRDFKREPTRVTHVGFVLNANGHRVLRHASRNPFARVVDEPIDAFFARNARYDKRPVVGFALYEVRAPMDRIATLTTAEPAE